MTRRARRWRRCRRPAGRRATRPAGGRRAPPPRWPSRTRAACASRGPGSERPTAPGRAWTRGSARSRERTGTVPPRGSRTAGRSRRGRADAPSETERVERLGAGREEDALRLEVQLERVDRELAPEARLLVAAERDTGERRERHVDPDHSGLDRAGDAVA